MHRKVMIATPCYGSMVTMYYDSCLVDTVVKCLQTGIQVGEVKLGNDSLVTRARDSLVRSCRANNFTDIFFIDADIQWTWDDFLRVLNSPHDVVGGVYPLKMDIPCYNFNLLTKDRGKYMFTENGKPSLIKDKIMLDKIIKKAGDSVLEVDHIPTGFMRIKSTVFDRLQKEVNLYELVDPGHSQNYPQYDFFQSKVMRKTLMSEDWFFCELARANGIKVYADLKARVNHFGNKMYTGDHINTLETVNMYGRGTKKA